MQAAAVVFKRRHQRIQLPPRGEIGGNNRRLNLAHAVDEHLAIVKPSEDVLRALQRLDLGRELEAGCFAGNLQRVTEFLERDANAVQPLLKIDRACGIERMQERVSAPCHSGIDGPAPTPRRLSTSKIVPDLFQLPDGAMKFADRQPAF